MRWVRQAFRQTVCSRAFRMNRRRRQARRRSRALVAERVPFSAVFVRNDVTAIGVVRGLRHAGLRIPGDVSVVSVNDSMIARSMDPPLTSVNVQPQTLGSLTFRVLSDRISGVYDGPPIYLTLKPTLSVYESTCAPSKQG